MRFLFSVLAFVFLLVSGSVHAQATGAHWVAGKSYFSPGFSGDGGLATSAHVRQPSGGAFDSFGNFYFADSGNHRVRKIDVNGIIQTVVGDGAARFYGDGGPATQASLNTPSDVLVLSSGELVIADSLNGRIRKVLLDGTIETIAGGGVAPFQMEQPALGAPLGVVQDMELSPSGEIWFSSRSPPGTYGNLRSIGHDGLLRFPFPGISAKGFAFSPSGVFYGANGSEPGLVFSVSPSGAVTNLVGQNPGSQTYPDGSPYDEGFPMDQVNLDDPSDVAFDENGMLYVLDFGNHRVLGIGSDGLSRRAVNYLNIAYPNSVVFGGGFPGYHILQNVFIMRSTGLPSFSSSFEAGLPSPPTPITDQPFYSSGLDVDTEGCSYGCNPVDLASGAKLDYAEDYRNSSPFPIVWDRRYDSRAGQWRFGYERSLVHSPAGLGVGEQVSLFRPDSSVISYVKNQQGGWSPAKPVYLGTLQAGPSQTWIYTNLAGQVEVYNDAGQLTELRNLQGQKLTFSYHSQGDLSRIEDDMGRYLDVRLTPTTAGVNPISVSDGTTTVGYGFSTVGGKRQMNSVHWPDSKQTQYLYDEGMVAGQGLLTGIIGRDGVRYATYTYTPGGIVESTSHGAGEDLTVYTYSQGSGVSVAWEEGQAWFDLSGQSQGLEHKTKGSSSPCPNCGGASLASVEYNQRGSITSLATFEGLEISRTVSSEGLVLSETRSPGTPDSSTTTYTWNPTTRQMLKKVEPTIVEGINRTLTTTFTYNSAHQLVEKKVTPNTFESARSWSWTYNQKGQILTSTSPVSGTTTFAYDSVNGNLLSATNALGHQIQMTDYTAKGQPTKTIDPNGMETKLVLDAMDRVVEVKRGSSAPGWNRWETVLVEYTDNNQVSRLTNPDGSWVSFAYDAAYRMVQVADPRGRLDFTLSNDGDVLKEEMRDAQNNLLKTEGFEYDHRRRLSANVDAQNRKTIHYYNDAVNKYAGPIDPEGETTWLWYQVYDSVGRLMQVNNNYYTREIFHNKLDQVQSVHDGNWVFTHYDYNSFGELSEVDSPDGGVRGYLYSARGLLLRETDARGQRLSMNTMRLAGPPLFPTTVCFTPARSRAFPMTRVKTVWVVCVKWWMIQERPSGSTICWVV